MWLIKKKLAPLIKSNIRTFCLLILISMFGISLLIGLVCSYDTLIASIDNFYEDYQYADGTLTVNITSDSIVEDLKDEFNGIDEIYGRLVDDETIIKDSGREITGRFFSYRKSDFQKLNVIEKSKKSDKYINISIEEKFSDYNDFNVGDNITVKIDGKKSKLHIYRIVSSPECCCVYRDEYTSFDLTDFGYIFIKYDDLSNLLNLGQTDTVNQILYTENSSVNSSRLLEKISDRLTSLNVEVLSSYTQDDSPTSKLMENGIDPLSILTYILPTLFFVASMLFTLLFLNQIIKEQKREIGIMMALGFSRRNITALYIAFSAVFSIISSILGTFIGLLLSLYGSHLYCSAYSIPKTIYQFDIPIIAGAFFLNTALILIISFVSLRNISKIQPTEAMSSRRSQKFRKSFTLSVLFKKAPPVMKVCISSVIRNKKRYLLSVFCTVLSAFLTIMSVSFSQSLETMIDSNYNDRYSYDCQMFLDDMYPQSDIVDELKNQEESGDDLSVECADVKTSKIVCNGSKTDVMIYGLPNNCEFINLYDVDGNKLSVPKSGIILSKNFADDYGVGVGDYVKINGNKVKVTAISKQSINFTQYCSKKQFAQLFDTDDKINSVLIRFSNMTENELINRVNSIKGYSYTSFVDTLHRDTRDQLQVLYFAIYLIIFFAVCIGFSIIYQMTVINLKERTHEFALLKTLGYSNLSISVNTFADLLLRFVISSVIGIFFGNLFSNVILDLMTTNTIIYYNENTMLTFILSALIVFLYMTLGHIWAIRKIKHMDIVEVMKERD